MNIIDILRQYKAGPFSIFDFIVAYGGLYLLAPWIIRLAARAHVQLSTATILWWVLPASVIVHLLIGRRTPLVEMVLDPRGHWIMKLVILAMIYLGARGIHMS